MACSKLLEQAALRPILPQRLLFGMVQAALQHKQIHAVLGNKPEILFRGQLPWKGPLVCPSPPSTPGVPVAHRSLDSPSWLHS